MHWNKFPSMSYTHVLCVYVLHTLLPSNPTYSLFQLTFLLINSPSWKFHMEVNVNVSTPIPIEFIQMNKFHPCVKPCIHSFHPHEHYYQWTHSSMFKSMLQTWALGSCISNPPWKRKAIHYMSHLGKKEGKWHVNKKCNHMENKGTCFEWKCITIVK
jgi:hypothetical protein